MGTSARTRTLTPRLRAALIGAAVVAALGVAGIAVLQLPTERTAPSVAATTPAAGPVPGAAPTTGSEVQAPSAETAQDDRIPPRTGAVPRITVPLPATAAAREALVDGYPAEVAAPVEGSDVLDTSLAAEGEVLQFTLVARSDAPPADILAHYGTVWTDLGLTATVTADGTTSFYDAFSSLTVSADSASGTGTVYTVFGVLRAS